MHIDGRAILVTCVFRDDVQQIVQMRLDEQLMTLLVVHLARGENVWIWGVVDSGSTYAILSHVEIGVALSIRPPANDMKRSGGGEMRVRDGRTRLEIELI